MLDISLLDNMRSSGSKITARCPACAEEGRDSVGNHLSIRDGGRGPFGCILHQGIQGSAHRKRIFRLVGLRSRSPLPIATPLLPVKPKARVPLRLPDLRPLNEQEMASIARLRGWHHHEGLKQLTARGLLWYWEVLDDFRDWPAWIITDSARLNAQARRLNGHLWVGIDCKAKSLPGSDSSWPIGAADIGDRPYVLLCEGQPDFCASLSLVSWEDKKVESVAPVCMTGAGNSIHPEALPYFAGKRIRIVAHADDEGRAAAQRWSDQLYHAGAVHVDFVNFGRVKMPNGEMAKDLADFVTLLDAVNEPKMQALAGFGIPLPVS